MHVSGDSFTSLPGHLQEKDTGRGGVKSKYIFHSLYKESHLFCGIKWYLMLNKQGSLMLLLYRLRHLHSVRPGQLALLDGRQRVWLCVGERFADVNVVNRVPHGDGGVKV